jgi:DNA-binding PadR family transcriptional regulator
MYGGPGDDFRHRMRGVNRMRGELRYFVMYLLKDKPMNGAEIMETFSRIGLPAA